MELAEVALDTRLSRLDCFLRNGARCASCGLEGAFFAVEEVSSASYAGWTLTLYGVADGRGVFFTQDHKRPKSLGGADAPENLQTMCWPCNGRKGSNFEPDGVG